MSELETTIALLFNKKGKTELTEKEFVFSASMDFRWFTPKEAQKLLDLGLESKLLASKEGLIMPTFNHKELEIPQGFKPSADMLKARAVPKGLLVEIVDAISKVTDQSRQEIMAQVNRKQESMEVEIEVAALIVASSKGVDTSKFLKKVESEINTRF